ncbi:MAG TPA: 7-cyano-7-deazaguanine synthase [Candidatus Thermoplasmatota archaeon]|nr:7-cyano-7-deazaguanine synthase [Candidatus Thermoplasmatota archaeon]
MTRALLLLSGGFDSPVAAKLLQEQGVELEAVHFSLEPFTDDAAEKKCVALAKHLGIARVHVVAAGPLFGELTQKADQRLYFVLSKRLMARVAGAMAPGLGCEALATGENVGQVSSQTLPNLSSIDRASPLPVLRPLIAWDKVDIIDTAKEIGTYEISVGPEVCDVLGPSHPSTGASLERVEKEEGRLDIPSLVKRGLASARVVMAS